MGFKVIPGVFRGFRDVPGRFSDDTGVFRDGPGVFNWFQGRAGGF